MKEKLKRDNIAEAEAFTFYGHSKECYKAFLHGVEWSDKNPYWRDANEDKPRQDEEVIAIVGENLMISFAHIVNKKYAIDYDGWNIPDVRYWMPCPPIEEEE